MKEITYHQREHYYSYDDNLVNKIIFVNHKPTLLDKFWLMCKNFDRETN